MVLKFAKLHDDFDFDDQLQIRSYFDDVLCLDFMKYSERKQPLLPETISGLIDAYNATPENFGVPSDEVIQMVIELVDSQMDRDSLIEDNNHIQFDDSTIKKENTNLQASPVLSGIVNQLGELEEEK